MPSMFNCESMFMGTTTQKLKAQKITGELGGYWLINL